MTRLLFVALLATCSWLHARQAASPKIVDATAGFRVPAGVKVEIVPTPGSTHPRSLAFADDGTLLVVEGTPGAIKFETRGLTYKDGSKRTISVARKKTKDAIKALSSSKGDGIWDRATVLVEEELLSSVMPYDGWLYVAGQGGVRRYKPSKPGGAYDVSETISQGFSAASADSGPHIALGPDGWLYISVGTGNHYAEGADGSRATVRSDGAILRCRPDGSRLETYAIGFTRPSAPTFDLAGNLFLADEGRLVHVPEAGDCRRLPPLRKTAKGAATSLFTYQDTRFPEQYRHCLLHPDADAKRVQVLPVEPVGASFKLAAGIDLLLAPGDALFRPTQLIAGPDGALYVVDGRDGKHGRVVRLSWGGTTDSPALPLRKLDSWSKIASLGDEALVKTLSAEDASDRERARRELVKRGEKNRSALIKLLPDDNAPFFAKLVALSAMQAMINDDVLKSYVWALAEGDGEGQRLAADLLGFHAKKDDRVIGDALIKKLATEDRALRRSVALALGRLGAPGAADGLGAAFSFDNAKDLVLHDGIIRAMERLGKPGIGALLTVANSGVQKDSNQVLEAFLTLRTQAGFDGIVKLLENPHLSAAQRADLVRSCANYRLDPTPSLDGVLTHLSLREKESPEVFRAMLEVLAIPTAPRGTTGEAFAIARLKDDGEEVRLQALKALRVVGGKAAVKAVKGLLDVKGPSTEMRREIVGVLGVTAEGAREAGQRFLDGKLEAGLRDDVASALRKYKDDAAATKLLAAVLAKKG